jgi:hypothetical protein
MKFRNDRAYTNSEAAARKLVEIANSIEPAKDGRIFIELINWPFSPSTRVPPPNTRRASTWRSSAAGCCCTNPGHL